MRQQEEDLASKVERFDLPFSDDSLRRPEAHVLAVDDSLVDRKVIERLLKISSCKVTSVDSGRRALQLLGLVKEEEEMENHTSVAEEGLKIDLIITDYCMPGMTGFELLKKIKESSAFRETPVVIMSSENVLARIDRCLEEGAEDFIVKPVKLSDVKRLMMKCMEAMRKVDGSDSEAKPKLAPLPLIGGTNKRKSPDDAPELSPSSSELSSPFETSPSTSVSPAESVSSSPPQSPSLSPLLLPGLSDPESPTRSV